MIVITILYRYIYISYTPIHIVSSNGLFVRLNNYYYARTAVVLIFETILYYITSRSYDPHVSIWCAAFFGHATAETQYNDFSYYLLVLL